jgi:3,4-dihydroxy 2-butanone 4-phosphate synthase / GTP cyclohydrolase II
MSLATIEEAIEAIRRGEMVILMDDKDRENEGDLCMAAEKVTPQAINFMATHGRGLICLTLTEERVRLLNLSMMVSENTSPFGTAFTVSIDSTDGITTGISAGDRAKTILDAIDDKIWSLRGTFFRCGPAMAACWCARARRRARSTWLAWPASNHPESSAKS